MDFQKFAEKIAMVTNTSDPKFSAVLDEVVKCFNHQAYKVGVLEQIGRQLAMVIVLANGYDRGNLENEVD